MSAQPTELRLEPDGVLRLIALPAPTLTLTLTSNVLEGARRKVKLDGDSHGLPNGTVCRIVCTATTTGERGERSSTYRAALSVPGWQPARSQPCSVSFDLSILESGLFGAGKFVLEVTPDFPHAAGVKLAPIDFKHDFAVEASRSGALLIGDAIIFRPKVDAAAFGECRVRVTISEHDEEKGGRPLEPEELQVQYRWAKGAGLTTPQTWQVGCDAGNRLDYAEPAEKDLMYEFHWTVEVTADPPGDGERWWPAKAAEALCTAPRPTLDTFTLEWLPDAVQRRQLVARGTIGKVSTNLTSELGVTLWSHRPAPWTDPGELRVMAPIRPRARAPLRTTPPAAGPTFEALLLDTARPADKEAASAPAELFAVLDIHAGHGRALPLSAALVYDPARFMPFGDGDLPRPARKQKADAVAVCACNEGNALFPAVIGQSLVVAPHFGPVELSVVGEQLVARAALLGGTAAYWKSAATKVEFQVVGETAWTAAASNALNAETTALEGRSPLSGGWGGHGKSVVFRPIATSATATIEGAKVVPPVGTSSAAYPCVPTIVEVTSERTTDTPAAVKLRAQTRYFPTRPTQKVLKIALEASADPPLTPQDAAKVLFALPARGGGGFVDPLDGTLTAQVTDKALLTRLARGDVTARVFYEGGALFTLAVREARAVIQAT